MDWHHTALDAFGALPAPPDDRYPDGVPFRNVLRHGSLSVEAFAPRGQDRQRPHRQDELYVVVAGRSGFVRGADRVDCSAGDVLFVPAGTEHRFVEISEDFWAWVVFYGPAGGEAANEGWAS
jgi:mannose-6-phosphate isomerase-like protein (cupin superfamily)